MVSVGLDALKLLDIHEPLTPRLLGSFPLPANREWAGRVAFQAPIAYWAWDTLRVVDFSDPSRPSLLAKQPIGFQAIWALLSIAGPKIPGAPSRTTAAAH